MTALNKAKAKPATARAVGTEGGEAGGKAVIGNGESADHSRLHRRFAPAWLIWDRQALTRCDIITLPYTVRGTVIRQKVDAA